MFLKGDKIYYADREKGVPVKCIVLDATLGHPPSIIAKREDTGVVFECRTGFYELSEYELAYVDAKIKEEKIIK